MNNKIKINLNAVVLTVTQYISLYLIYSYFATLAHLFMQGNSSEINQHITTLHITAFVTTSIIKPLTQILMHFMT